MVEVAGRSEDHVQGLRPPEGVGVVAESVGGQGLEKEGQGHVVERGEGHEKGEKGMEGMADTDQRLCVNSFHVNMYFTYTLQNISFYEVPYDLGDDRLLL